MVWECTIPRPVNCFQKQKIGYRVVQGFVETAATTCGRVQGEVQLVSLISCIKTIIYLLSCVVIPIPQERVWPCVPLDIHSSLL